MRPLRHRADAVTTEKERRRREKERAARQRACFDDELTHLRAGEWQGEPVVAVALVGTGRDLHGTQCTCCTTRTA